MNCERARLLASAALDDPLPAPLREGLDAHAAVCADCRHFAEALGTLRQRLRLEPLADVPDVSGRVRTALEARHAGRVGPPRGWLRLAAVFVAGATVGSVVAGIATPRRVLAAGIDKRVLAVQGELRALSAAVTVIEYGWHPRVPARRYEGALGYRSPETLVLDLRDTTTYPSPRWTANDVRVVVDGGTSWNQGPAPCPSAAQPECGAGPPRRVVVDDREPFDPAAPVPLDLVVPVRSFAAGGDPPRLGVRDVDGRRAVGVDVTVAQVSPLLDGVVAAGDWRALHPTDRAELWLDERWLVPLSLTVRAADGYERRVWAAAHGYPDEAGEEVFALRLASVRVNGDAPDLAVPAPPPDAPRRDGGFVAAANPRAVPTPNPARLPPGLRPHRNGIAPGGVGIRSWSDGRAWLKVRATGSWPGGRLFGGLGPVVRRVEVAGAGVVYVGEGGAAVGIHTPAVDVVVTGSLGEEALLDVATSMGLAGQRVPPGWAERRAVTLADAAAASPGVLVPSGLEGFDGPGVQVVDGTVVMGYVGAGSRAFLLTQTPGEVLSPPLDANVLGVAVRGVTARYTPARGELEWVEEGRVVSLRSTTLSLPELVAVAATLEPVR